MRTVPPTWTDDLGVSRLRPPVFFRSLAEIDTCSPPHPQAHAMRRAWQDMKLNGILCIGQSPAVYFKAGKAFDEAAMLATHRQVWNQGIAPVLVLIGQAKVHVLSGLALPATDDDEQLSAHDRLIAILDRTADALEIRNLVRRIELGDVFRQYSRCFDPTKRVDRQLLENLAHARSLIEKVRPRLPASTMYALLGRLIFICYLVDREIISDRYFAECGANNCHSLLDLLDRAPSRAKTLLYALFRQLKEDFNGDLFDADLDGEARLVTGDHIEVLRRFLSEEDLDSGQLSLGFRAYDFRFIPIETISAIYERFLDLEDAEGRRRTGAYYTPRFLAEIVLDLATQDGGSLLDRRFLDPSCGSGIFLVGAFNRLAEEWRARNPGVGNLKRASALITLLQNNIFGVDRSETACRIASLSLYLALLDQLAPRDIQALQARGRCLPRLVSHHPTTDGTTQAANILNGDFFDDELPLPEGAFDVIVGNPPWARVAGPETAPAEAWCAARQLPMAQRQLAYAFAWKTPLHLRETGQCCLVLPAATLFNHQDRAIRFQAEWFQRFAVDLVVNLADLSFYLFDGADRPAIVARYSKNAPSKTHIVRYVVPKTELETLRAEILSLAGADEIDVSLRALMRELRQQTPPLVWKKAMWATPRGGKFIDRLSEYPTLGDRLKSDRHPRNTWELGEGFNVGGKGHPVDRAILHELPFLPTEAVDHYVVTRQRLRARPRTFSPRYLGKPEIFRAPHVLFAHGVSRLGERLKVAFSGFDCSFEHSLRGVHAPAQDESQLRFLACALSSPLALYFFFHTVANWGTERAKIHVAEYGRFPFPLPDSPERQVILDEVVAVHRRLELDEESSVFYRTIVQERQVVLDNLVYDYYEVDSEERLLIDDTIRLWIPSATPTRGQRDIPALRPSSPADRDRYVRLLVQTLMSWMKATGAPITAHVIVSSATSLAVVCLRHGHPAARSIEGERTSSSTLDDALARVEAALPEYAGSVRQLRDLKVFDGPDLYVIKPLAARYWSATAALNDADEVFHAIAQIADGAA